MTISYTPNSPEDRDERRPGILRRIFGRRAKAPPSQLPVAVPLPEDDEEVLLTKVLQSQTETAWRGPTPTDRARDFAQALGDQIDQHIDYQVKLRTSSLEQENLDLSYQVDRLTHLLREARGLDSPDTVGDEALRSALKEAVGMLRDVGEAIGYAGAGDLVLLVREYVAGVPALARAAFEAGAATDREPPADSEAHLAWRIRHATDSAEWLKFVDAHSHQIDPAAEPAQVFDAEDPTAEWNKPGAPER